MAAHSKDGASEPPAAGWTQLADAGSGRPLLEHAALAGIAELVVAGAGTNRRSETMNAQGIDSLRGAKAASRAARALGDYHRFARATVWGVGEVLVRACGISPGQRVLDVAAGTGNTAIAAARAGAEVVTSDLTPENFEAGRREAKAHGAPSASIGTSSSSRPARTAARPPALPSGAEYLLVVARKRSV